MDKCQYKTSDYKYTFTCIVCGEVWYYPTPTDPLVCNGCENTLKRTEEDAKAEKLNENHLKLLNEALKKYYYDPMVAALNEPTPFMYRASPVIIYKPNKIKRKPFWKR